ncbi:MAG: FecR domain-containing protein [Balneolaceae bacterium]|nr:FecR domain-containing protein [Balneolaceae bacterium]MBO6547323.1 FecR domain-containing protein [Balneolaceae bacterium]MBO6647730.1 FecR domain-containing protein [Balneolaceae bacterium]
MATEHNLPDNDRDLMLAQSIGKVLASKNDLTELKDELIDKLVDFKTRELTSYETNTPDSASIWNAIEFQTKHKANVLPMYQRPIAYTWAAAAVLLIAAFIGFYWISLSPTPELVAQSDSIIQTVTLEDGTEVTLRPYSELYELSSNDSERSYSINGEAFFDVTSDVNRPFSVQAGDGLVTVLGTRFNVSSWGSLTQVYLEEGSVRFESSSQNSVILQPGQRSELLGGTITDPVNATAEEYTDWLSNTIVFNASNPEDVVAEIGQHFNITININQLDDTSTLDGTLRLDSASQTLEDLGLVLGGTFRELSPNEYTFISLD